MQNWAKQHEQWAQQSFSPQYYEPETDWHQSQWPLTDWSQPNWSQQPVLPQPDWWPSCKSTEFGLPYYIPHPYQCNQYFQCNNDMYNTAVRLFCPKGLVWNIYVEVCDFPFNVRGICGTYPFIPPTDPITTIPEMTIPLTTHSPTTQQPNSELLTTEPTNTTMTPSDIEGE